MKISLLLGMTLKSIVKNEYNTELVFNTIDDLSYIMDHEQNCCENVYIEDICGDLDDLISSPILQAGEITQHNMGTCLEDDESYSWTFYKLGTIKGRVTIRWYGSSNGWYSQEVDFRQLTSTEIEHRKEVNARKHDDT